MEIGFYQINADDTKDRLNLNKFNSGVFKDKNPAGYQNCTIDKPTLPPEKESSFTCASTTYYDLINSKIEIYGCLGESKKEEEFTYNHSIQYDNLQVNYTSSGILKYKTSNYKYLKDNIYRDIYYDINKVNPKISFKVTAENDILSSHGKAISQSVAIYPFDVFSSPVIITIINSKSQPVRQIKSRLANLYSTDMENVNYTNYPIYQAFESSSAYNISTEELNIEDLNDTNFKVITSFMPVCIANAKSSGTGPTFYLPNGSDSFNVTLEDV